MNADAQLEAIARVHDLFAGHSIEYWLFGGWAVDFHVGAITRTHDDLDIAVWGRDATAIATLLERDGWRHAPEPDEDGGTGYEREGVRLELTFVREDAGTVVLPLAAGDVVWSTTTLGTEERELRGTRARVVPLERLRHDKAQARSDEADAAKDRADFAALARVP